MIYPSEIALILCWIAMAAWQAHLIKRQRPIYHGIWALLSGFLIAAATFWAAPDSLLMIAVYAIAQGVGRLVAFNIALNFFRGDHWDHMSPTSTSILDRLEIHVFGDKTGYFEAILFAIYFTLQPFLK